MKRSETNRSSLSIVAKKLGNYKRYLAAVNVIMLLSGLTMMFFGAVLHLHYEMDSLGFISDYFKLLPILMLSVGSAAFFTGILGFIFLGLESKPAIIIYGTILALISPAMIATVFVSFNARTEIATNLDKHSGINFNVDYIKDPDFRHKWDQLQKRVRCCGDKDYSDFFGLYDDLGQQCYPNSCCVDDNCGIIKGQGSGSCDRHLDHIGKIYTVGCMRILKWMYKQELEMGTMIFAIAISVVAVLGAVGVALSCAYVGHLTRRAKKWDVGQGYRDNNSLGMPLETFNDS